MKKRNVSIMMVMAAALLLFSMNAWADAIFVDDITHKVLGNAGEATVTNWLNNTAIANYTGPPAIPGGTYYEANRTLYGTATESGPTSITFNYTGYVVLHWGGQFGGIYQAYYMTGGDVTFTTPTGYGGLSFVATYDKVPVPAAVWLLGSGLVGLVGMRRKLRK